MVCSVDTVTKSQEPRSRRIPPSAVRYSPTRRSRSPSLRIDSSRVTSLSRSSAVPRTKKPSKSRAAACSATAGGVSGSRSAIMQIPRAPAADSSRSVQDGSSVCTGTTSVLKFQAVTVSSRVRISSALPVGSSASDSTPPRRGDGSATTSRGGSVGSVVGVVGSVRDVPDSDGAHTARSSSHPPPYTKKIARTATAATAAILIHSAGLRRRVRGGVSSVRSAARSSGRSAATGKSEGSGCGAAGAVKAAASGLSGVCPTACPAFSGLFPEAEPSASASACSGRCSSPGAVSPFRLRYSAFSCSHSSSAFPPESGDCGAMCCTGGWPPVRVPDCLFRACFAITVSSLSAGLRVRYPCGAQERFSSSRRFSISRRATAASCCTPLTGRVKRSGFR